MTATVPRKPVTHTPEEKALLIDQGIRLERAGAFRSFIGAFLKAQEVLPEHRRRPNNIVSTNAIKWFVDAIKAFRNSPEAAQRVDTVETDTTPAVRDSSASDGQDGGATPKRITWSPQERQDLCAEAARLLMDLQVGSPHEALVMAQERVLRPDRHRAKIPPSSVAHWYPEGRQEAMARLRSERERAAAEAELTKLKVQHSAHNVIAPAPAPAPDPEPAAVSTPMPAPSPEAPPQTLAPVAPTNIVIPSPEGDLASHLFGLWKGIRERLVQEVSNVFVEGIHRGMQRITLMQPPMADACESATPEPIPTAALQYATTPAKTKPGQSVLVVGLKGNQPEHIKADFAGKLDLRFCSADQSKDQLRSMASAADVTVAVTDFISHSHEDIIKARAPRFIRCAGGITHLKQELARLSSASPLNGQAHA